MTLAESWEKAKASLPERRVEVLNLVLEGNSNKEIAKTLRIKVRTVKYHMNKIMHNFGIKNREGLLDWGFQGETIIPTRTIDDRSKHDITSSRN